MGRAVNKRCGFASETERAERFVAAYLTGSNVARSLPRAIGGGGGGGTTRGGAVERRGEECVLMPNNDMGVFS